MRGFITKRKVVVGAAVAAMVAGAIGAYAYWTSSGTGAGTAATGTAASSITITQTQAPTGMAPGVAPGEVSGTVTNSQPTGGQNEFVTSVTVSIASVTETPAEITAWGSGTTAGTQGLYICSSADYTLTGATMSVNQDLTPGQTADFAGAMLGFKDSLTQNQDACQGATVNLAYVSN